MTIIHPAHPDDTSALAAMRAAASAHKGDILGPTARPMLDAMLAATPAADGVRVEAGRVNGVAGIWCRPRNPIPGAKLLYLHGGGYVLGSPTAFAHFAGQIAARAGADTFLPDYRLAPEHAFPAAIDDIVAVYKGLATDAAARIAVAGDSAGGGLTLSLLAKLVADPTPGVSQPVAAAVMSPWVDLTLSAASMQTRADADPIFTRDVLLAFANLHLQGHDASDPGGVAAFAALQGLPRLRIDVGDDEILLDDATRVAERAERAGVDAALHIWTGMPHVFQSSLGILRTAATATDDIGRFLRDAFGADRVITF